jgi:hypothetical protein
VIFANASGIYNQDNSNFFWDDTNNYLGVGTSSPAWRVDVLGSSPGYRVRDSGSTNGSVFQQISGGNTYINVQDNAALILNTNNTERVRVDSSGNVGVGTASPAVKLDVSGAIASSSSISDSKGNVRSIPQNSQSGAYVLVAADAGKHISITTGGVTVNTSVFSTGDAVTIYNNSASSQTITQGTSVTMYQAGTSNTGNRTLGQRGLATILCVGTNTFVISGAGLT